MVKNSERFEEMEDLITELDEELTRIELRLALFERRVIEAEHQIMLLQEVVKAEHWVRAMAMDVGPSE